MARGTPRIDRAGAAAARVQRRPRIKRFREFTLLVVVLPVHSLMARLRRGEVAADPTTKKCAECFSDVAIGARRCAFCTSALGALARRAHRGNAGGRIGKEI